MEKEKRKKSFSLHPWFIVFAAVIIISVSDKVIIDANAERKSEHNVSFDNYEFENLDGSGNVTAYLVKEEEAKLALSVMLTEDIEAIPVSGATIKAERAIPIKDTEKEDRLDVAISIAEGFLDLGVLSKSDLITQLVANDFTQIEAIHAVNNANVDWMANAEAVAKKAVESKTYSKEELINYLEEEGFTYNEAIHGVEAIDF